MTMLASVTCRYCGQPCDLAGCASCYAPIPRLDRDETIKRIRAALRRRSGKAWSVKGGRGTAWGWIAISVPPARLACPRLHQWRDDDHTHCRDCGIYYLDVRRAGPQELCSGHACTDACYRHYISPEDRAELAALLDTDYVHFQGVSIPSGGDYYVEYVDRAEGRKPRKYGVQYWD